MYEPVPEFFSLLEHNRDSFEANNAAVFNCAVSDEGGRELKIACTYGNAGAAVEDGPLVDEVRVKTRTLDTIAEGMEVAFLKIDVDGYEGKVLRGGRQMLERCKPVVFMEFYPRLLKKVGEEPSDLLGLLTSAGLSCFDVYHWRGEVLAKGGSAEDVLRTAAEPLPDIDIVAREVSE